MTASIDIGGSTGTTGPDWRAIAARCHAYGARTLADIRPQDRAAIMSALLLEQGAWLGDAVPISADALIARMIETIPSMTADGNGLNNIGSVIYAHAYSWASVPIGQELDRLKKESDDET